MCKIIMVFHIHVFSVLLLDLDTMMYGRKVLAAALDNTVVKDRPVAKTRKSTPQSEVAGNVILLDSKILDESYWLTDVEINLALHLMKQQWPEVSTQDCLYIQRPYCFNQVVKQGFGLYAQVMNKKCL